MKRMAEQGVSHVSVALHPDGSADVQVDEGKHFVLPPTLAALLAILVADDQSSDDKMVSWKSIESVIRQLGVRRPALAQLLYRLRKELSKRGSVNPFLVQSNRRRGLRFAVWSANRVKEKDCR